MNDDLISRQAAINLMCRALHYNYEEGYAVTQMMALPSAQVERKTGKWILDENPHDGDCRCSNCLVAIDQMHERNHGLLNAITGGKWWTFYKFCPYCGADMRERNEDGET